MPFTNDDIEQILRVVDGLSDVEVWLELGDIKLHVRKSSASGPAERVSERHTPPPPTAEARRSESHASARQVVQKPAGKETELVPGTVAIRAPMLGKFYRSPSPKEPPFVEVGKRVRVSDPVCLIEVMKLFNTVNAGVDGTVVSIAVENEEMIDVDDILFVVKVD